MYHTKEPGIDIPHPRRIKFMDPEDGYYHIVSRALQKEMRFGENEKRTFLTLLKWLSKVYFVRIATFSILDNHVHLVLKMIPQQLISEAELERRLLVYYEEGPPRGMEEAFEQGDTADYYAHFSNLSMFMWDLKLRFARWYNKMHKGYGHVWAERFTSVLVVGKFALRACMIYVELNAVRAGIVNLPEDYSYCGLAHLRQGGRHSSWLDQRILHEAVYCHGFSPTKECAIYDHYRQVIYHEGMGCEVEHTPFSSEDCPKKEFQPLSKSSSKKVFLNRIAAMTEGDYIDDLGICHDLFNDYWESFCKNERRAKKVLTLPNGIPLDQLLTLLDRSAEPDS